MVENKESLNDFVLRFIEKINSEKPIEQKINDLLAQTCEHFHFKRGFVYQTDGFRFFYLKETIGNEDKKMRDRFETDQMSTMHSKVMQEKSPFYTIRTPKSAPEVIDVLNFHGVDSILIRHFKDTEGKVIGFIGFADSETNILLNDKELNAIEVTTGLLSKEIAIREYQEREIRASKTLESIMNNMGVDIYVNSFDDHEMLYANTSMAAPYGGIQNFMGKKCWQALYKDKTGECEFCPKKHLIDENGNPTKVYSWDYQRPFDKSWFRVFSAAFSWTDGQMAHVITSVDITNQKNIEEQLRIAKEKAESLDRLKSAFLANMSHEIRTPLNSIVGFASLLVDSDDKKDRKEYIDIMQENTDLLLQLISDILDLSKIEAGTLDFNMGYVYIKEFCEDIIRLYEVKEDKKVPVVFDSNSPNFLINSDKKRLMQVITNFINNALKFTTEGEVVLGYYLKEDNMLEFFVKDTGMGIASDKVGQVFDRFVKLNSFSKGTGLGLSICRSIIEQLHGTIGAESEPGVGSRFWFTHPYNEELEKEILGN
ncbi:HAMP domain-containing sensor histidine kinase [Bacteroides sp. 224]|uniref:GAF domain-containing sensor histidine kinase n=1 Tax=Bacteroides sp. 224 TaxID=2302936 RepID=UPI0013D515A4|nr:HAMP domain-containing sensor histidine kinase [Bacteroides sp. 224]NDV64631.1 sensor histidine kinase [Bacteroides sp. 224]